MIFYMSKGRVVIKNLFFVLFILFGIFLFVYGGYDDSPGAQLLGFVLAITALLFLIKKNKNTKI